MSQQVADKSRPQAERAEKKINEPSASPKDSTRSVEATAKSTSEPPFLPGYYLG